LPDATGTQYALVLESAGEPATWSIAIPEQRVDAELVCEQPCVRRGEILRAVIRTAEIALQTGVAYGIQRWNGAWRDVDLFRGEPGAWAAMALMIPAFTACPKRVLVPEHTKPGRHRLTKCVDAEHRGIGPVELAAEFAVRDAPAVDYRRCYSPVPGSVSHPGITAKSSARDWASLTSASTAIAPGTRAKGAAHPPSAVAGSRPLPRRGATSASPAICSRRSVR
jgi:hypothetical protein